MVLAEETPDQPAEPESPRAEEPPLGPIPKGLYSPWDAIAQRQDAAKEAAWQAYAEHQQAKQDQQYAQFLQSDDPQFCADYLTVPIDPEVAAYAFPEEDPPRLPGRKKTTKPSSRDTSSGRQRKTHWREVPLEEPLTYQQKRYLAWTYYHLKLQDLELQEKILAKQAKIDRLRRELGETETVCAYQAYLPQIDLPKVQPNVEVVEFDLLYWLDQVQSTNDHQQQDTGNQPRVRLQPTRSPPKRGPP